MSIFKGTFYSSALKRNASINVIFPERSGDVDPLFEDAPKVLYLLHGLSGNEDEWLRFTKIEYYAKKYNFIVVMPGADRSFYCNTRYGISYFDHIAKEVPSFVDSWFRISTKREDTFIAGESMGGYGALKIGLSCPDRYAAIASLSGVVDYGAFADRIRRKEFTDMMPEELDILDGQTDLLQLAEAVTGRKERPELLLQCGTEDFLYEDNQRFRRSLEDLHYEHTYREGPGDHEWPYWDKAIQYAFMFFRDLDPEKMTIY